MSYLVSICIPTLNRPDYLLIALRSIEKELAKGGIQVCISNNSSNTSYEVVEKYIENLNSPHVTYVRQKERLNIDESMLACVNLCEGEYVYYLGDDDFFLTGALESMREGLLKERPDFFILRSINVDQNGQLICENVVPMVNEHLSIGDALSKFAGVQTFGALGVKRAHLSEIDFKIFFGTSHAYCCFWLNIDRVLLVQNRKLFFMTTKVPCVALRQAEKTYTDFAGDIFYRQIPLWFDVLGKSATSPNMAVKAKELLDSYIDKMSSWKDTLYYLSIGVPPKAIEDASQVYFDDPFRRRVKFLSRFPGNMFIVLYKFVKILRNNIRNIAILWR